MTGSPGEGAWDVLDATAAALGWARSTLVGAEAIKHGLTNRTWRVRTSDGASIIVRCSHRDDERLAIDRRSEAVVLRVVSAAGIAPEVLCCNPQMRLLITRDLGEPWTYAAASNENNMGRLAQALRRLHQLEPAIGIRALDLDSAVQQYLQVLDAEGLGGELTSRTRREHGLTLARSLRGYGRSVLCHNDVHHLNVIDSEPVRLIDWEYAAVGEPLFDLASVSVYHRYSETQRKRLLGLYAADFDATLWQRMQTACWLFEYVTDLWHAVRETT